MSSPSDQTDKRSGVTGLAIPAGLMIGIGVGMLVGNVAAGTIIGLGAGFVGMMIIRAIFGVW